jgi:hypothetical protein
VVKEAAGEIKGEAVLEEKIKTLCQILSDATATTGSGRPDSGCEQGHFI